MNKKRGRVYREKRREAALARMEDKVDISPAEQIAVLDERLGVGVGAARERQRLTEQMGWAKRPKSKREKK